ncbi:MAG TPA: hypothetical protein VF518_03985, partial [Polyangia bacterium]
RWVGWAVLIGLAALIPLGLGPYRAGPGVLFWSFYGLLLVAALWAMRSTPFPVFAGAVLSAWLVGNLSEYVGSAHSGVFSFPHNPHYPPFFLVTGCWPLETFVQYAHSAFFAGEQS